MGGPIPKRSSQRRRRNQVQVDRVIARGSVAEAPPLDIEDVHPLAQSMYDSLARSAHSVYMEESDWQYARWAAFVMSQAARKPTAIMVLAADRMLSNLMVCESDRRRMRVEIERSNDEDSTAAVAAALTEYRTAVGIVADRRARLMITGD